MGVSVDSNDLSFARTWRRIGLAEVWGIPMLVFTIIVTALLSFAFDAVRLNNYSPAWFPINALAFLPGVAIVVIGWYIGQSPWISKEHKPWLNIAIAGTALGCKNVTTLLLCSYFGVNDSGDLWFRFFGGAAIGIGLLIIYSNLIGAKKEQDLVQKELQSKEESLLGFRENIAEIFAEEEAELRKRTASELGPRLHLLEEHIASSDAQTITQKINSMLINEVRPISDSLAAEAKNLQVQIPKHKVQLSADPNVVIDYSDTIRPVATTLMVFLAWLMTSQIVLPQATGLDVAIASATYLITISVIRLLVKPVKNLSHTQIFFLSSFPGFLASVPGYLLLYQVPHNQMGAILLPTFLVFGGWVNVVFTYALLLERGRQITEKRLNEILQKFETENKIFEQKLWVAQHAWYTLLHGEVQSALTAASIRASSKSELSSTDRALITQDLARASRALANPAGLRIELVESLKALKETWSGITDIKLTISPELLEKISHSNELPIVINEILKEAVTNAVRHGSAKSIEIELASLSSGKIQIQVVNDGLKPVSGSSIGVGSNIFSKLCLSTSLTWNPDNSQTEFKAIVPVA